MSLSVTIMRYTLDVSLDTPVPSNDIAGSLSENSEKS